MSNNPKVSVILPVYNAERFLREAVDSILSQTFTDFELLIFNDGSTDSSAQILSEYTDQRIIISTSLHNQGYVTHLNTGIATARGMYIARMDADDVSFPERFAKQVRYLDTHPKTGLVGSSTTIIDPLGITTPGWHFNATPAETDVHLLFTNYFAHPTVMLRKSMLPTIVYRPEFMPSEDFDLWTRIAENHDVWSFPEPLLFYRAHTQNISTTHEPIARQKVRDILRLQLERLGMHPTDAEADFHNEISFDRIVYTHDDLHKISEWYQRIEKANIKAKRYPADILRSTLLGRYYVICRRSGVSLLDIHGPFWTSTLLQKGGLSTVYYVRSFARILLKYLRYNVRKN